MAVELVVLVHLLKMVQMVALVAEVEKEVQHQILLHLADQVILLL